MRYLIALLALAGLIDSAMALRIHYQDPNAAPPCAVTEHFDCGSVNHSRFSVFPPTEVGDPIKGLPVAAVGVAGYALILVLALAGRLWLTLFAAEAGFFCAAMLSYLEAFVMEKWCIYCLFSQCVIAAILLAAIVAVLLASRKPRRPSTEHSAVVVAHD